MSSRIEPAKDSTGILSNTPATSEEGGQLSQVTQAKYDIETLNLEHLHIQSGSEAVVKCTEKMGTWETPQKHVPSEILAVIFVHCLGGRAVPVPPFNYLSMPWLLGHICSRWRKIALEEHQLWDNIWLTSCRYFPRPAFEEVICRSGESRTIKLNHIPREYFEIILPTLQHHHNRFRSLEVEITRPTAKLLTEMFLFERLESLSIRFGHALDVSNVDDSSDPNFVAPASLRDLIISSGTDDLLPLYHTRINPTAPFWEYLTSLEVNSGAYVPVFTMLRIMEKCKALVECSLLIGSESGPVHSDSGYIAMPSLQSIMAQSTDPVLAEFFASLVLPSLRTLKMVGSSESWPQREILALLDRSECDLEVFYHADFSVPVEHVIPLIRAMPRVVRLSLDTDIPIPSLTVDTIISENLLGYLAFITAWFDSSRSAQKLLEKTWGCSEEPDGGVQEGILYIDSADVRVNEEACMTLKRVISRRGADIVITVF